MRKIPQILLLLSFFIGYSQTNFTMEISAPVFEKDSILISPPESTKNVMSLYSIKIHPNKDVKFMERFNAASIKVKSENIITGYIEYPQPIVFNNLSVKQDSLYLFFLEKGDYKIRINNKKFDYTLLSGSPINEEYSKLKHIVKSADLKLKPFNENKSEDIIYKQKLLQAYIKKNPNSYVAFWEIVNDFSKYGFNTIYIENMSLFSKKIKEIYSYKKFDTILQLENSTNVRGNFPDVQLNPNDKITKTNFSDYKLTLIDYWATTCKPCIQDLPQLTKLYDAYKNKGVNFISIASDASQDRMKLANKILTENKVSWNNYFDINKEFPKKLNAAGYPLQILVDQNGKIIARKLGEFDQIKTEIEKYIQ